MKVVVGLGAVAVLLFLALQAVVVGRTVGWNQRLTLVIETPQGEVRGSSVTRVEEWTTKDLLAPGTAMRRTFSGEAVAVEVLPGKWLFALLQGDGATGADGWAYKAYAPGAVFAQPLGTPVPIPADGLPLLVTFDDIAKPETVRRVDPEDLAAVFGEGVRLMAVTLEITEEAVTAGRVEGVLGWMRNNAGGPLVPRVDMMDFSLPAIIRRHQFIQRDGAL